MSNVQNLAPQSGVAAQQQLTPDQRLQNLQIKVANRGAFGHFTAWLRNTAGVLTTDNQTMVSFRQAIKDKVGDAGARAVFEELNLQPHRALTEQQAAQAINLAKRLRQAQATPLYQAWGEARFVARLTSAWATLAKNRVSISDPRVEVLGDDELVALHEYTGDNYLQFQASLRSGNPSQADLAQRDAMNSGLAKLPKYEGWVHRGANIPESVNSTLRYGEEVRDRGFTSSTRDTKRSFPAYYKFAIYSRTGKQIDFLSQVRREQEVLFPTNTKFAIACRDEKKIPVFTNGEVVSGHVDIVMFEVDYD